MKKEHTNENRHAATIIINDHKPKIFSDVSFACANPVHFFLSFSFSHSATKASKLKRNQVNIFYFTSSIQHLWVCRDVFFFLAGELLHFNKLYHIWENEFKTIAESEVEERIHISKKKRFISFSCEFLVKNEDKVDAKWENVYAHTVSCIGQIQSVCSKIRTEVREEKKI